MGSHGKHPKARYGDAPRDDLKNNPAIGASKGSFATGERNENIVPNDTAGGKIAESDRRRDEDE